MESGAYGVTSWPGIMGKVSVQRERGWKAGESGWKE